MPLLKLALMQTGEKIKKNTENDEDLYNEQ